MNKLLRKLGGFENLEKNSEKIEYTAEAPKPAKKVNLKFQKVFLDIFSFFVAIIAGVIVTKVLNFFMEWQGWQLIGVVVFIIVLGFESKIKKAMLN